MGSKKWRNRGGKKSARPQKEIEDFRRLYHKTAEKLAFPTDDSGFHVQYENKLSAKVIELVQPLLGESPTRELEDLALEMGVVAWNMAILPKKEQTLALESTLGEKGKTAAQDKELRQTAETLKALVKRKDELFPEDKRCILGHEIVDTPNGRQFNVVGS